MTELINIFKSYPPEEQQRLLNKYKDLISTLYKTVDNDKLYLILYCLEYAFKYLNNNYKSDDTSIKSWCFTILMRNIKNNIINSNEDIEQVIVKIVDYLKTNNYADYLKEIDFYSSAYDRDLEYINKLYNQEYY